MMYEYLKKLKVEHDFMPAKILDIGAWNGFWTNNVKKSGRRQNTHA